MKTPFRLALVGAGKITQSSHLPAALAIDGVRVEAIVDPELSRTRQIAKAYGIEPRLASSVNQVLEHVDGAIVATPNHTHKPIAEQCLDAGVSVLIEKPLARSYQEGREIVEAARRNGKTLTVGYCTRYRANVRLLQRLLSEGRFGQVTRFAHQFGTAGGWAPLSGYNLNRETSGGGVLAVTGTHFLDRMLYFWGYPDRVEYVDDSAGGPEANCSAQFH